MRLITFQQPQQTATAAEMKLGERGVTPDGRIWKYVHNTTTAVAAGAIVIPDGAAAYQGTLAAATLTASANPVGQVVYLTYSTGGLTAGALEEGWLYLYIGTGEGKLMKVKTNSATVIEVYPQYALAATTSIDATTGAKFWASNQVTNAVITTQTQIPAGIAQIPFAIGDYGWVLVQGYGTVLGSSLVAGHGFGPGGATVGYGLIATTAKGAYDQFNMGYIVLAANDASNQNFVYVTF